jgi:hypothetical protein
MSGKPTKKGKKGKPGRIGGGKPKGLPPGFNIQPGGTDLPGLPGTPNMPGLPGFPSR